MKDAVIKIIDSHISDGEEYSCELTTSGTLDYTPDGYSVTYHETDEELKGSVTVLKVSNGGNTILMTRKGKFNTEMVIEKDRRHTCFYETPYGELMMGIYANLISNEIVENGGTLKFAYAIDFNNTPASENELLISVTEKIQEE